MILYFSATGNCRHAAKRLAESLGETAISIEMAGPVLTLSEQELLGFVFPTYFWELPVIVRDFLEKVRITGYKNQYVFVLAAYGTTPGASAADAVRILQQKQVKVQARYSLQTPDTWTPIFDLSDPQKTAEQNRKSEEELEEIIESIRKKRTGNQVHRAVPLWVRNVSNLFYEQSRQTRHLQAEESCIGCGMCARNCPVQAIQMENGRPVWVKAQCVMCLRCLHHCPKFAIRYGKKTAKHGQYHHPEA